MVFAHTPIEGLLVFEPSVFHDSRGYFFESFNQKVWEKVGIMRPFVQDNQAFSVYGVLRGLHYQRGEMAQAKLVRVLSGEVLDVAVDLRKGSPTLGQWFSIKLSADNKRQLYVPRGFAHGYAVLSATAELAYKCDNFYSREHEGGIRFDDPDLAIDWEIDLSNARISEKDLALPFWYDRLR